MGRDMSIRAAEFERVDVLCLRPKRSMKDERRAHPHNRRKKKWRLNFGEAPEPVDRDFRRQF